MIVHNSFYESFYVVFLNEYVLYLELTLTLLMHLLAINCALKQRLVKVIKSFIVDVITVGLPAEAGPVCVEFV